MNRLFSDDMYRPYEVVLPEDKSEFEYAWFEADGFNILDQEWRERLENLAKEKLSKLRSRNPKWRPYIVYRDHQAAYSGRSETMKPLRFGFRLEKKNATFISQ